MNSLKKLFLKDSTLIPLAAIFLGMFLGAVIMLLGSYNPLLAYGSLFQKAFGNLYGIGETIRQITPLIFTGLAVAFAFRTGLFNIGVEGQFIMGSVAAAFVGITLHLPWYLEAPLAVLAAGIVGGLWGAIAGALKAWRGVHEVITTIMLNWIALYFANYLVRMFLLEPGQQRSKFIDKAASISLPYLSDFFQNARIHVGILIALFCAYIFFIILWKTKLGFELRAVGLNPVASEYAGMNVKRSMMLAMLISGVFAGIGGAGETLGVFHYQAISAAMPGYGFLGIAVALIGRNTSIGTILAAVLLGTLTFGSAGMKFGAGVPEDIINIVIALIIFFVAASGIVRYLFTFFNRRKGEGM